MCLFVISHAREPGRTPGLQRPARAVAVAAECTRVGFAFLSLFSGFPVLRRLLTRVAAVRIAHEHSAPGAPPPAPRRRGARADEADAVAAGVAVVRARAVREALARHEEALDVGGEAGVVALLVGVEVAVEDAPVGRWPRWQVSGAR